MALATIVPSNAAATHAVNGLSYSGGYPGSYVEVYGSGLSQATYVHLEQEYQGPRYGVDSWQIVSDSTIGFYVPYANEGNFYVIVGDADGIESSVCCFYVYQQYSYNDNDADGYYAESGDCDDNASWINPGASDEPNNGVDENCDGYDTYDPCYPGGCGCEYYGTCGCEYYGNCGCEYYGNCGCEYYGNCYTDNDGDGWDSSSDCHDGDWSIHPGAYDTPNNGVDEDCSGSDAHELTLTGVSPNATRAGGEVFVYGSGFSQLSAVELGGASVGWSYYHDGQISFYAPAVGDGYHWLSLFTPSTGLSSCCVELFTDADYDSFRAGQDCDDANPSVYPGAPVVYNDGVDQDCDGADEASPSTLMISSLSSWSGQPGTEIHVSGSGFSQLSDVAMGGMSAQWWWYDDAHFAFYVPALPDGGYSLEVRDHDDSTASACCFSVSSTSDFDGDGWSSGQDCNDWDASVYPGAYDYPGDDVDQDCDGYDAYNPSGLYIGGLSSWSGSPGSWVTLYGAGFYGVHQVTFGGYGVGWSTYSDNEIGFYAPYLAPGYYEIAVYDSTGMDRLCCYYVYADNDGDGWSTDSDCNDSDGSIHPGAYDRPGDGIDQDCDGMDAVIPPFRARIGASLDFGHPLAGGSPWLYESAEFGVQDGATDGFDAGTDAPHPPAPLQSAYHEVYFSYPGNDLAVQKLSTDVHGRSVRASFPLSMAWTGATSGDHTAMLSWCTCYFDGIPSDWTVYLLDGGNVVDMRASDSYSLVVSGESGARDMHILVSTARPITMWLNEGWNLLSLPVAPLDASVGAVFGSHTNQVVAWQDGAYVDVTEGTLQSGVGYWVHHIGPGVSVEVLGEPVYDPVVALQPGWNLVGPGFEGTSTYGLAPSVSTTAFSWSFGYYGTTWMNGGYGYWLYSHETGATVVLDAVVPAVDEVVLPKTPTGPEFELAMGVSDSSGAKDAATLLAKAGATEGFDASDDVMEAPRPAADVFAQAFLVVGGMRQDVAAVSPASEAAYVLRVERDGPAGTVTLGWAGFEVPEGFLVELVDGATRIDMSQQTSYAFTAPAGASVRALQVTLRPAQGVCAAELDSQCLVAVPKGLL